MYKTGLVADPCGVVIDTRPPLATAGTTNLIDVLVSETSSASV